MEIAVIHFIILGVISGLTKGTGVLPDGPLHRAVGEPVMFTTTLDPPETPFVNWKFGGKDIITYSDENNIAPEYEGRITLFMSTGSLELRNLTLNDSGVYSVNITFFGGQTNGNTRLDVHDGPENVQIRGPNEIHLKETLTLTCSAESVPASYTWTLNGKKIHYSAVYTKLFLTVTDGSFGGLSAGAIAGIVIACLVVLSAVAGGGYYIHKKKIDNKAPPQSDNKEVEECVYENTSTYENPSTHENTSTYENM